ncbi:methylated-DNA--[protein]-cysteine S-methyltransferase [Halapricum hydrolyticum]|uniref:MGMT family protein n=1 Tax=Halapricum hydrolyticum TaxID=2979991 RepID=A0AAE3LG06_9EURY|nr:methylated-DNA--[protein]-cysteine S-methyltransferase [Halapricum hydrolyticum]MCU4719492.1 MGMT family protein [Halapricum hydrolyticum]MCU4728476.1 MGMT family protein [Halapricum hydrolyticum]
MTDAAGIYARESSILDRHVQTGVAGERVLAVSFPDEPDEQAGSDHPLLDRIESYLEGERDDFADVTVALTVPTDRRSVLEALRDVPYGEDVSVEQLTRMTPGLDPEEASDRETVRMALRENPAPLLLPDHRVRDGPSAAPSDVVDQLRRIEGL